MAFFEARILYQGTNHVGSKARAAGRRLIEGSRRLLTTLTARITYHPRRLASDTTQDGSHQIPPQTVRIR